MRTEAIYSELLHNRGVRHHHLHLAKTSKAGKVVGNLYSGKMGELQVFPNSMLLAWENYRWAN